MEREEKREIIVNRILTGSSFAEPKAGPEVEVVKYAMKKYCFIRDSSFNNLGDEYELDTGSVRT